MFERCGRRWLGSRFVWGGTTPGQSGGEGQEFCQCEMLGKALHNLGATIPLAGGGCNLVQYNI